MGDVILQHAQTVSGSAVEVFNLFGRDAASGWLFSAECDSVVPGATVSMEFPLEASPTGHEFRILGRLTKIVPYRSITISHDQPWAGRTKIAFDQVDESHTSVTVRVELDEEGLAWLTRRLGFRGDSSSTEDVHKVGLLTSKTGPGAIFAVACENLARMSVEEINADGGLQGRRVELVVGDDRTDPSEGVIEARRLINAGCRVIVASVTSATFEAVRTALAHHGVALVHAVLNEGGVGSSNVLRWGERPASQLHTAARPFMREGGVKNWFLVGNDYSWSHGAHSAARKILPVYGGRIAGEELVKHGTPDLTNVIEQIQKSGADCILSTLVGADEVAFERQAFHAGLRSQARTLSLVLDESTHERIGTEASEGLWAVSGYFENLDTPENRDFVDRYRVRFGRWAPPISSFSEAVYEAMHLYARAVRGGHIDDPSDAARSMLNISADFPRGMVKTDGPQLVDQVMYLAESSGESLRVFA